MDKNSFSNEVNESILIGYRGRKPKRFTEQNKPTVKGDVLVNSRVLMIALTSRNVRAGPAAPEGLLLGDGSQSASAVDAGRLPPTLPALPGPQGTPAVAKGRFKGDLKGGRGSINASANEGIVQRATSRVLVPPIDSALLCRTSF